MRNIEIVCNFCEYHSILLPISFFFFLVFFYEMELMMELLIQCRCFSNSFKYQQNVDNEITHFTILIFDNFNVRHKKMYDLM